MAKGLCEALLLIFVFHPGLVKGSRIPRNGNNTEIVNIRKIRKVGDQPSEGNCQVFKWGGSSGVHWYGCCNNCANNDPNYHPYCDGETYQTGSSTSYCDTCGEDRGIGGAGKYENQFQCGGCSGQDTKRTFCRTGLRSVYRVPGLCWKHIQCFKYHCWRSYRRKKRDIRNVPETCFNLQCEDGETIGNCPVDCCFKTNPTVCTWEDDKCIDECCGEPSCCSTGNILQLDFYCGIILILVIFLVQ